MPNFTFDFNHQCLELSKEVCNSFLAQLLQKPQLVKVGCAIKSLLYEMKLCTSNFDKLLFLSQLSQEGVTYQFGNIQALVIEIKSRIGQSCVFNTRKFSSKIASFIVVYLVGINSQSHTAVAKLCLFKEPKQIMHLQFFEIVYNQKEPTARVLSSPSGTAKEDKLVGREKRQ